jgi:hypothetical protein
LLREHDHLLYFGHGEINALVTSRRLFRPRRVLVDASNLATAPGRVVVAVACWSAEGLGRAVTGLAAAARVSTYVGWRDEVSWPPGWPDPIGNAVVAGISALVEGNTAALCADVMRVGFAVAHDQYRDEGRERLSSDEVRFGKMCAIYWKERMVVEGEYNATI